MGDFAFGYGEDYCGKEVKEGLEHRERQVEWRLRRRRGRGARQPWQAKGREKRARLMECKSSHGVEVFLSGRITATPGLSATSIMFRLTRPVLHQVVKKTTGITGLAVHPNPLPELAGTYQSTLSVLSSIPSTSVYRQGVETLTKHKLNIVQGANGDIAAAEKQLDEGQIEESLDIAKDELKLVENMLEWKA